MKAVKRQVSALYEKRDFTHRYIAGWVYYGDSSGTCVTPKSTCLKFPFPTDFSLDSLTFLSSYSTATNIFSASQLTQSSSDFPKALQPSQIQFLVLPRAVHTSH